MLEAEPEKPIPIACYVCKRGGSHRRWELCQNNHYELVCFDCASSLESGQCCVRDCSAKTLNLQIREVATTYQKWMKNLASNLSLLSKYESVAEALVGLHEDTRIPFQQAVESFLKTRPGITRKVLFQNYLEKLTKYIISARLPCCREDLAHIIEQDDKANTDLDARIAVYEEKTQAISKSPRIINPEKESMKLEKYPINCLICFNNFNVMYKWTYCENDHLHNSICFECLYKVRQCPVCRGKLRTSIIKSCEDSRLEWDSTLNQHLSINQMINLVMKDTLSTSTRQTIFAKLQRENSRIKPIQFGDYTKLVENLSMEWCRELDSQKYDRIFQMIEAYEQEYELLINLKKIIQEKLGEYSKRFEKKVVEVSDDSSSIESSDRSEVSRRVPPRRRSRSFSSVDSQESESLRPVERRRSRSIERRPIPRRDPRVNRSRSRSRSRSRDRIFEGRQPDRRPAAPRQRYRNMFGGEIGGIPPMGRPFPGYMDRPPYPGGGYYY